MKLIVFFQTHYTYLYKLEKKKTITIEAFVFKNIINDIISGYKNINTIKVKDSMSLVSQSILEADDELRYCTIGELEDIQNYLETGLERIEIIVKIKGKEKDIIRTASKQLFQIHPDYIAPGGNANGSKQRSLCLRDYGWYLRLITYGILAGDKEPIERIGLIGVKEMYNSLGVPIIGMIDSIECLKKATTSYFSTPENQITEPYFDYIIRSMAL